MFRWKRLLVACGVGVLIAVLIAWGANLLIDSRDKAREVEALAAAKMLGLAALQYAQDHNNRYPDAGRWEQELAPYLGREATRVLHPPAPFMGTPRRFSLNPFLAGKTFAQVASQVAYPGDTWMFYESVAPAPSATDDLIYWPNPGKDGGNAFAVVYFGGYAYSRPFIWKEGVREHLPGL